MTRPSRWAVAVGLVVGGMGSMPAHAITCSMSTTGIAFGVYDPLSGSNLDSTGTLRLTCSRGLLDVATVNYRVTLSAGNSGTTTERTLMSSSNTLTYNLYSDAARTSVWGNDANAPSGTITFGLLGTILFGTVSRELTVYGRAFANQLVAAGAYRDTLTATVLY